MNKRTFIKFFGAALVSAPVMRLLAWAGQEKLRNWAGNIEYSTNRVQTSTSLAQVQDYVKAQPKLKVLGTRHCFNNIADSKDGFLSLKPMDEVISLDPAKRTVTVAAGITYGQLCPYLDGKGFALHNLASLPHISVAGACSTATHGSGQKNGNLARNVSRGPLNHVVSDLRMVEALGGVVSAFDVRPAAREQVLSLGATFVANELVAEDAQAAGGYARAQTADEQTRTLCDCRGDSPLHHHCRRLGTDL